MHFRDRWFRMVKKTLVWLSKQMPSCGTVWMLHECIVDMSQASDERYAVSVGAFEQLIQRKINENYKFCSLEEIRNSDEKSIFVTFDDGKDCIYREALPLLEKYHIPFCIFVITGRIGQEGYLTKEELLKLATCQLCTLGAHTVSHNKLRECSPEKVRYELIESKVALEKIVNYEIKYFAYPYGDIKATSWKDVRIAKRCHYSMAFSTLQCHINKLFIRHSFFIPRLNINNEYATLNG